MGLYGTASAAMWRTPIKLRANSGVRPPLWVSCWTRGATGSTGVVQGLAAFAHTTGPSCIGAYINESGSLFAWDENDATNYQQAAGFGIAMGANVWQHVLVTYPSLSARHIWFNGLQRDGDLSALSTPQTLDTLVVGAVSPAQTYLASNRMVAEVVFGQGDLSAFQIQYLGTQGANPLAICPNQILAYFPLRGDLSDSGPLRTGLVRIGNPTAIFGEHPLVAPPPKRFSLAHRVAVIPPATVRPRITMVSL